MVSVIRMIYIWPLLYRIVTGFDVDNMNGIALLFCTRSKGSGAICIYNGVRCSNQEPELKCTP